MDAALREEGTLELAQDASNLLLLLRFDKPVLQHTAEPEAGPLHKDEKLGGARMHVGRVDPARLKEANRQADVEAGGKRVGLDGLGTASASMSLFLSSISGQAWYLQQLWRFHPTRRWPAGLR